MKGVVLAGGLGTRLFPLTKATNKHLLPVYDKPMIFYPIELLKSCGIDEILVVVGGPHAGHFLPALRNGEDLGLSGINFAFQEGGDGGIADALLCAEHFVGDDSCAVILGDNIFIDNTIREKVASFARYPHGCMLFTKEVPDPERFGVPVIKNGKVVDIWEKPENPPCNKAVVGLYVYDNTVFDKIRTLTKSRRGELEVTDLNLKYLQEDGARFYDIEGIWKDCGTPEALLDIGRLMYEKSCS